jgi:ribosomal protein S18 acetylase RimI-like enzyme
MNANKLTFRNPTLKDAQAVNELMERCEIAEYGEPDSDIEDLLHDWGQIDLRQDARLAFTPQGMLVSYSGVFPYSGDLHYDIFSDPDWEDDALAEQALAFCLERSPAVAMSLDVSPGAFARVYIAHANSRHRAVVERAGFAPVVYHFQMWVQLDIPLEEPDWPAGVKVHTAVPEQDAREVHTLIEAAFARPGRTPTSFDDWKTFMLRDDIFDPDLWFLAFAGTRMVGACLCFAYPEFGWVRQLGVVQDWRRKGLGTALLQRAFLEFQRRGFEKAGLVVSGNNPDAYRLYQEAGMRRVRQYDEYEKTLEI